MVLAGFEAVCVAIGRTAQIPFETIERPKTAAEIDIATDTQTASFRFDRRVVVFACTLASLFAY